MSIGAKGGQDWKIGAYCAGNGVKERGDTNTREDTTGNEEQLDEDMLSIQDCLFCLSPFHKLNIQPYLNLKSIRFLIFHHSWIAFYLLVLLQMANSV